MILKMSVVGVQVGGWALPTIFPMQYAMQSGALAGRRRLSPLRLCLPSFSFPSFLSYFSSSHNYCPCLLSLLLSTIPPLFLPFPFLLPAVLLSVLTASESRQLLLVMTSLQTSAQWHHNNFRNSSLLPSLYHFQHMLKTSVRGLRWIAQLLGVSLSLWTPALWYHIASRPASEFWQVPDPRQSSSAGLGLWGCVCVSAYVSLFKCVWATFGSAKLVGVFHQTNE